VSAATDARITNSVIRDNRLVGLPGSGELTGGGLSAFPDATDAISLRNVAIVRNTVVDSPAGELVGSGGGIGIDGDGTVPVSMLNTTIAANGAEVSGGIQNQDTVPLELVHTTIGANAVEANASAININGGPATLRGSIIDTPPGVNACNTGDAFTTLGDNVGADQRCDLVAADDHDLTPPLLGSLSASGGLIAGPPGFTEALPIQLPSAASVAVDLVPTAGSDCDDPFGGALVFDQRGLSRPVDRDGDGIASCDAGAAELQAEGPATGTQPPPTTATPPPAAKKCRKGFKLKKGKCKRKKRKGR
jgi:hypothetical protein